jgi:hypothetical protein
MQLANKESMDGRSKMDGTKKTLLHARMRTRELLNRGVPRVHDSVAWPVNRHESRAHEKTAGASILLSRDVCYDGLHFRAASTLEHQHHTNSLSMHPNGAKTTWHNYTAQLS